jgi:5-methylcytosine-specific restriction protein A
MAEPSLRYVPPCVQCGVERVVSRGPLPTSRFCRPCSNSVRAKARQSASRKRPAPCLGCGCVLPTAHFKRCAPCNKAFYLSYQRDRWAAAPKWNRQEQRCDGCQSSFTPHVPTQRYCSKPCRAKADSRRVSEARPLYRYARWLRLRREQLRAEPLCRFCGVAGIETAATVCDHVVPHRGNVDAFWSGPFQSLCVECHNRDKQRMECRAA